MTPGVMHNLYLHPTRNGWGCRLTSRQRAALVSFRVDHYKITGRAERASGENSKIGARMREPPSGSTATIRPLCSGRLASVGPSVGAAFFEFGAQYDAQPTLVN
jgi:hypothetical protein